MAQEGKLKNIACKVIVSVLSTLGIILLISIQTFAPNGINSSSKKRMESFYHSMTPISSKKTDAAEVFPNVQIFTETGRDMEETHTKNLVENFTPRLPGCIIIGSKKCGTGALISHLDMHPEIAAKQREPHFFDNRSGNFDLGFEWYREQMPNSSKEQITIEKSPRYFITRDTPRRILEFNNTIKLILIVRDPVTRAISDYVHTNYIAFAEQSSRKYHPSFETLAIDNKTGKVNEDWVIINTSKFSEHFEHWLKFFPRKQIHIVDGETYITDPVSELRKVETFLGIQHWFKSEHFKFDSRKGFMCASYGNYTSCLGPLKGRKHPDVRPEVVKMLKDYFTPYNKKFYELSGHDYGWERL